MKTLKEQLNQLEISPVEILFVILDTIGIEERGGGPEGIYYTHPNVDGEYLFRSLPSLFREVRKHENSLQNTTPPV